MKRFAIFMMFVFSVAQAQVEYTKNQKLLTSANSFSVDAASYLSKTPDKTKVDFFVQVPYSSIQFIKRNDGFYASYNITISVMDKDKNNILSERGWKETVHTNDFNQTISKNNFNLSYKSYDFTPGDYFFKFIFEDLDSRNTTTREFPFSVTAISDTFGLSDVVLISEFVKDSSGESIIPNVSKSVTNRNDEISFYYEVYSRKDRQVHCEYYLENLKSGVSTKTLDPQNIKAGNNTIYHTLKNLDFKLGDYNLKVTLKDDNFNEIATVEKRFYSKIFGVPSTIADLDKAVDQMIYIASPAEIDFIRDEKNYEERLNKFIAFWDKKKPNPRDDYNPILYEYYRRIDYATQNFKGLGEGWRTDMGMIYVTFGPPSNVERHPFDANSRPYEIWDYFELNRAFVFVDNTGFGDYRLVNPDYSRWPGYRQ